MLYTSKHKGSVIDNAVDKIIALIIDSSLSTTSINPVQNKAITLELNTKLSNKTNIWQNDKNSLPRIYLGDASVSDGIIFRAAKNTTSYFELRKADNTVKFRVDMSTGAMSVGSVPWSLLSSVPSTFTPAVHTHLWADLTDKPATFAPSAHDHGSFNRATSVLTGANVFSNFVVSKGIVTSLATRALTASDIGAATSGHVHTTFDRATSALTGANVFSDLVVTDGIVTAISSRTMTLANFGVTSTAAELNKLDGLTATTAQLNYVTGVTSAIQTQLNGKAATSHGNHVPNTQTANNAVYLRNDNTWQTITPAKIGAAASSHAHTELYTIDARDLPGGANEFLLTPSEVPVRSTSTYFGYFPSAGAGWKGILTVKGWSADYAVWQLIGNATNGSGSTSSDGLYYRTGHGTTWRTTREILHSGNYNDYAPTKTGTGASGSWGISVTGSSASCTGNAATASTATKLTTARTLTIGSTGKTFNGTGNVSWTLAEIGAAASSHNHTGLTSFGSISGGNATKNWQMSFDNANYVFMRDGTATSTIRFYPDSGDVWFSGTLTSGTVPWARVSGAPTSYPASDVSAWAKAATKPSYTYSEVGAAKSSHSHSYLPLSGGTITGTLTYTNSFQYHAASGGWARGLDYNTNDGSSDVGFLGALGTSDTLTYLTMGTTYNDPKGFRWYPDGTATLNGSQVLHASNYNSYAPTKTGTGASGTWGISVTGNAATASTSTKLTTARTLTIGGTGKTFNGSANVSWTLAEIGALPLTGGSLSETATAGRTMLSMLAKGVTQNTNLLEFRPAEQDGYTAYEWGIRLTTSTNPRYFRFYATAGTVRVDATGGFSWDGQSLDARYAASSHTHSYLPLTGNAASATKLATARTLTIGSTGKTFNGSANVSWTLAEIGAAASSHTHSYLKTGGSISSTGAVTLSSMAIALGTNTTGSTGFPSATGFYTLFSGSNYARSFALWKPNSSTGSLQYSGVNSDSVTLNGWKTILDSNNYNDYAPTKTGTGASGSWGISVTGSSASCTGNAATATKAATLTTARTLTIGSKGKTFNGSANVSWTLAEIGAAEASHTHSYVSEGGTTFTGTYPLVARIGANNYYSHTGITFIGSSKTLKVDGPIHEDGTALSSKYQKKIAYGSSFPSSKQTGDIFIKI